MGTPGSPPARVSAVPDKWVRPTRRLADLIVGPTDLSMVLKTSRRPYPKLRRLGVHVRMSAAPPINPKIA